MVEYTWDQADQLRRRWIGHDRGLNHLISLTRTEQNWHISKVYKDLLNEVLPLPEGVKAVPRDLRGAITIGSTESMGPLLLDFNDLLVEVGLT